MKVSLDTNIIIHLYSAGLKKHIFNRFENVVVHDFLVNSELRRHAQDDVFEEFQNDIKTGQIEIITREELVSKCIHNIFDEYVRDLRILYDPQDLGEVYAIALAKTLGINVLATDDIKPRGPHYSLIREIDTDIIPFAFYELFFLDFLEDVITASEFVEAFNKVSEKMDKPLDMQKCVAKFDNRFWYNPISEREGKWFKQWLMERGIDYEKKYRELTERIE